MRKNILGALIAGAFAFGGSAHAGLTLDLNGSAGGGVITANALDWAPTSFLAKGGNAAIRNFNAGCVASCNFDVYTHAKLTGYDPGTGFTGLPVVGGEITMVAKFTEKVTSTGFGGAAATFATTGAGYIEFYYSSAADSVNLTGANFNNGRLIGRLDGIGSASGSFFVSDPTPVALDGSPTGDQFPGQATVTGSGSQTTISAGTTGTDLDPTFFLTSLAGFSIKYANISIGLPYSSVSPSDCYNITAQGALVGTDSLATQCIDNHVLGDFAAQGPDGGYVPVTGAVNGLGLAADDFVAQTDYNSPVTGAVPEPGSLALVGLALGALGFAASRRRRG